jgi:hypothetical protein
MYFEASAGKNRQVTSGVEKGARETLQHFQRWGLTPNVIPDCLVITKSYFEME